MVVLEPGFRLRFRFGGEMRMVVTVMRRWRSGAAPSALNMLMLLCFAPIRGGSGSCRLNKAVTQAGRKGGKEGKK